MVSTYMPPLWHHDHLSYTLFATFSKVGSRTASGTEAAGGVSTPNSWMRSRPMRPAMDISTATTEGDILSPLDYLR